MIELPSIAIFSGYYPSHGGGIEIVTERLAEGLSRHSNRVLWCALDDGDVAQSGGFLRVPLPGSDVVYRLTGTPMPLPSLKGLRRIWTSINAADAVLIAEANFLTNAIAFAAAKLKGKPVLLAQHLGSPSTASYIARLLTRISESCVVRPMLQRADKVVYVSAPVSEYFGKLCTREEPLIIGHGVDTTVFRPATTAADRTREREELGLDLNSKIACFVGRCTASKGIEIIAELARCRPDWSFVIAGSGPIDPTDWNLPNVRTAGHLDPARLASLYRVSDVLVLPSPSESFSLVVREALACGTQVICGDSILLTDRLIRRFVRGIPVDLKHKAATARRFAEALDATPQISSSSSAYVSQQCSWDGVISRYLEALAVLLQRNASATMVIAA